MSKIEQIDLLINKYFNQRYSIFKHTDAKGNNLKKSFIFESQKAFQSEYLKFYKELDDVKDMVNLGCCGIFKLHRDKIDYFIRHPHQEIFIDKNGNKRGIEISISKQMEINILNNIDSIVNVESFDEIIKIIESEKVSGFGDVSIYDTAIRFGSFLNRMPDKVYLHGGVREGLKNLERNNLVHKNSSSEKFILVDDLPEPLQKIQPIEVENILCLYKKEFGELY